MLKSRFIFTLIFISAMLLTTGCAINRASASLTPGADLTKVHNVYVVKVPEDTRNIDELIKAKLVKRGYAVTTGPEQQPPYASRSG